MNAQSPPRSVRASVCRKVSVGVTLGRPRFCTGKISRRQSRTWTPPLWGRERSLWLFLRIGLLFIGAAHQIVQTDVVMIGQLDGEFQREGPFLAFIFGIEGLVA